MSSDRLQSRRRREQVGFTLIEVLISVLIFALGILALVGLQASAVKFSTDAQQRAEATFLADQLLARMLIADPTTAATFNHRPTGTGCNPGGSASTNAIVTAWLAEVVRTFPNAATDEQQIVVSVTGTSPPVAQATIRLCWQNGVNDTNHVLEVTNVVQWQ